MALPLSQTLRTLNQYANPYSSARYKNPYGGQGLTEYEQKLVPFVQEVKAEHERKFNLWQPIEFVFDLLSRGQYVTANTAKQILRNAREGQPLLYQVPREAWQGLTGQEKGDWSTVLWGGQDVGGEQFAGAFQGTGEELEKSWWGRRAKGAAALAANILLDPTTYIGFGPTRGAKGVAQAYAKNAIKIEFADIAQRVAKGEMKIAPDVIEKALAGWTKEGQRILASKLLPMDINKQMSKLYKEAYKEGLRLPMETLKAKHLSKAKEILNKIPGQQRAGEYIAMYGAEMGGKVPTEGLAGLIQYLKAPQTYRGAGTRAMRFMRKEFAVGERYPATIKAWDNAIESVQKSKIGGVFSNAFWGFMNNPKSPVAMLKKAFNVRSPYQQVLANLTLDTTATTAMLQETFRNAWLNATEGLDQKQIDLATAIMENIQGGGDLIEAMKSYALEGKDAIAIEQAVPKIKAFNDMLYQRAVNIISKDPTMGNIIGYVENYVPMSIKSGEISGYTAPGTLKGPRKESFEFTRESTFAQQKAIEQKIWQIFGPSSEEAKQLVGAGATQRLVTDGNRLAFMRAAAEARFEQKAALISQFREFGLNLNNVSDDIRKTLEAGLPRSGLIKIDDPALEGYLFDKEVSEIFKRVVTISKDDSSLAAIKQMIEQYTNWWRAWATMSPGFHLRNMYSNIFTLFMKNGMRIFNPQKNLESVIGTFHGLYGEGATAALKKIGYADETIQAVLNKQVGKTGFTLAELTDMARSKGVISRRTMGIDIPQDVESMVKMNKMNWNPMSTRFAPFKGSHEVGAVVESQPRFLSFLLDLDDAAQTGSTGMDAVDFAVHQAKKWFIDYSDLSPFEQKVMRKVIPFYCFPDETEILTRKGWLTRSEIEIGNEVLTYNVEKDICEWQTIDDIAVFDFDDELLHLKGKWADFYCTKDHRWPIENGKTFTKGKYYGGDRKILRSYELNSNHRLIMSAPCIENETIFESRIAAILGWIVTDGYYRWRGNYLELMIYQSPKKHAQEIRELLGEYLSSESIHPQTKVICFRINANLSNIIKKYFKSKDDLPSIVTLLSTEAKKSMYEAMFKAEGSIGKKLTTGEFRQFGQMEGPVLDAFQILCQLLNKPFGYNHIKDNYYSGYIRKTNRLKYNDLVKEYIHYKGKIWCPRTKNSTVIMRQNGKVICTGQTWLRKNIANQLTGILEFKEMYSMVPKMTKALTGAETEAMPEYMKQAGYVPLWEDYRQGIVRMLWPNLPYMDINLIPARFEQTEAGIRPMLKPEELLADIFQSAHPLIKNMVELVPAILGGEGYDAFFREKMGETAKVETTSLGRLVFSNPQVVQFLDGFLRSIGVKEGLQPDVDDKGRLVMSSPIAKILNDNVLFLKRAQQFIDLPEYAVEAIRDAKNKSADEKDDLARAEKGLQILSFYLGIKMKNLDEITTSEREAEKIMKEAEERLAKERRKEPGAKQRSLKYIQSRMIKRRKVGAY